MQPVSLLAKQTRLFRAEVGIIQVSMSPVLRLESMSCSGVYAVHSCADDLVHVAMLDAYSPFYTGT